MFRNPNEKTKLKKSEQQPHTQLQIGQATYDLLTHVTDHEKMAIMQALPGLNESIFQKIIEKPYAGYYKVTLGTGKFSKATLAKKTELDTITYVAIKKIIRPSTMGRVSLEKSGYIATIDEQEQIYTDRLNSIRTEIKLHKELASLTLSHSLVIQDHVETTSSSGLQQIYQILPLVEHDGDTYLKKIQIANLSDTEHLLFFNHFAFALINAVKELHENNIYHRDLKPDNLLISHSGKLYITDFGLARCFPKNNLGPALSISHASYLPYILPYRHVTGSGLSFSDEGQPAVDSKPPPLISHRDDCDAILKVRPDPYTNISALSGLQDAWSLSLILIQFWNKEAGAYLTAELFKPSKKDIFSKKTKEEIYGYYEQIIDHLFSDVTGLLIDMPTLFKKFCHSILVSGLNTILQPEEAKRFSFLNLIQSYITESRELDAAAEEKITDLCSRISTINIEKEKLISALEKAQALIKGSDLNLNEKEQILERIQLKLKQVSGGMGEATEPLIKLTLSTQTLFKQNNLFAIRPDKTGMLIEATLALLNKNDTQLINRIKVPHPDATSSAQSLSSYI